MKKLCPQLRKQHDQGHRVQKGVPSARNGREIVLWEKARGNKAYGVVGHYTEYLLSSSLSNRSCINEDESRLG